MHSNVIEFLAFFGPFEIRPLQHPLTPKMMQSDCCSLQHLPVYTI